MTPTNSRRGVLKHYERLPLPLQEYFEHLPKLVEQFPWDVPLIYQFARVELGHRRALYCGVVKLRHADRSLAWRAVQLQHISRESFPALFRTVIGCQIDPAVTDRIQSAETVRDGIMHGKHMPEPRKRDAVVAVLDYSHDLNELVASTVGSRPFGDLRGFKGRGKSLDNNTSR